MMNYIRVLAKPTLNAVNNPETDFERELTIFGNEVEEAIQCFYVWKTVHDSARKSRKVHDLLDKDAGFWNLAVRACKLTL